MKKIRENQGFIILKIDGNPVVPDDLPELLDFAENLDEGLLSSLFSLTQL